jgi:hypothetical protein
MPYRAIRFFDSFRPGDNVPPDTYDPDTLAGLVSNGTIVIDPPDEEPDPVDLETLTVPELRKRAKAAGVVGYSRMTKAALIAELA